MPVISELEKKKFEKLEQENLHLYDTLKKSKANASKAQGKSAFFLVLFILTLVGFACYYFFAGNNLKQETELVKAKQDIKQLKKENDKLVNSNKELQQIITEKENDKNENNNYSTNWKTTNLIYTLQIGGYTKFKLQFISDSFLNMLEYEDDGMIKYSLGLFSKYKEAESFMRKLHIMGIDCFLTARYKGEKISIVKAKRLEQT